MAPYSWVHLVLNKPSHVTGQLFPSAPATAGLVCSANNTSPRGLQAAKHTRRSLSPSWPSAPPIECIAENVRRLRREAFLLKAGWGAITPSPWLRVMLKRVGSKPAIPIDNARSGIDGRRILRHGTGRVAASYGFVVATKGSTW